jgi:hypothetical protein
MLLGPLQAALAGSVPFERTEDRDDCDSYELLRQPFFGETHLHTSYSFDAYTLSTRNDPDAAYQFAKGAPVSLPDALARGGVPQTRTAQLREPLDFAAVTDHSELFGEMQICTLSAAGTPGRDSFQCRQMQTGEVVPGLPFNNFNPFTISGVDTFNPTTVSGLWALNPIVRPNGAGHLQPLCGQPGVDCDASAVSVWNAIQQAAEDHYDRSSACDFTTFVAYEYTAQPLGSNLHRNVIFRNAVVPDRAISNVETGGPFPTVLWQMLRDECVDKDNDCDVLTIPHNANLAGGLMFPDPADPAEAAERAFFEPLTEIYQHKGSSECRYDRLAGRGVDTMDPLCTFEQIPASILGPQRNPPDIDQFPRRNMIRNVLKDGMALAPTYGGVNPFKLGIIGGTDSHNGDPGNTVEQDFQGHAGSDDAPLAKMLSRFRLGPGALAVAWAEENSRDSLFAAMRRKETYATSGTRPIVRFFGGWDYDQQMPSLCDNPDQIQIGYDLGVPMGGDLPPQTEDKPTFLVSALQDPESAPLDRIQIVKGWVDAGGETHEHVFNVAGNLSPYGSWADPKVCDVSTSSAYDNHDGRLVSEITRVLSGLTKPSQNNVSPTRWLSSMVKSSGAQSQGASELCTVWRDDTFDPNQAAFYYVRVLETPTCRWSTLACKAAGVDPFATPRRCKRQARRANLAAVARGEISFGDRPFDNCCLNERNDSFAERTIQERAWTSPIWYTPAGD